MTILNILTRKKLCARWTLRILKSGTMNYKGAFIITSLWHGWCHMTKTRAKLCATAFSLSPAEDQSCMLSRRSHLRRTSSSISDCLISLRTWLTIKNSVFDFSLFLSAQASCPMLSERDVPAARSSRKKRRSTWLRDFTINIHQSTQR